MKKHLITIILALTFASPALAEKPTWAGKGKPTEAMKAARSEAMESKEGLEQAIDEKKEKMNKGHMHTEEEKAQMAQERHIHTKEDMEMMDNETSEDDMDDKLKGLEKQKAKKAEQMRNELGKGSEQGQAAREQHNKKWWKFWGDE